MAASLVGEMKSLKAGEPEAVGRTHFRWIRNVEDIEDNGILKIPPEGNEFQYFLQSGLRRGFNG